MASVTLSDQVKVQIRENALKTVPYTPIHQIMSEVEYNGIIVDSEVINELLIPRALHEFVLDNKKVIDLLMYHLNARAVYGSTTHTPDIISSLGNLPPEEATDVLITTNIPDELINFDAPYNSSTHWRCGMNYHTPIRYQTIGQKPEDPIWQQQHQPKTMDEHVFAIKLKGFYTNQICSQIRKTIGTKTSNDLKEFWPTAHSTSEVPFIQWEQLPEIVRKACTIFLQSLEILEKRSRIKSDMEKLLNQVRSTSQFLKVFPEGKHLLPPNIIQKMHQQKPKRNTVSNIEAGDLSIVKQSILMDKLGAN